MERFSFFRSSAAGQWKDYRVHDRRGAGRKNSGHSLRKGFRRLLRKLPGLKPTLFEKSGSKLCLGESRGGYGKPGTKSRKAILSSRPSAQKISRYPELSWMKIRFRESYRETVFGVFPMDLLYSPMACKTYTTALNLACADSWANSSKDKRQRPERTYIKKEQDSQEAQG